MTLEEYRMKHSMLIEQYQWIESDLESLYAAISHEPFCEALREIEKDSIGGVVREIKKIERERNIVILFEDEYEALDKLRERRNFWSHVCYTEECDGETGVPRNAYMLAEDLRKARTFLDHLRQIKEIHMARNRHKIDDAFFADCD